MSAEWDALAEVISGHLPTGDDNIAEGLIGCSCGTPVRANFEGAGGYIAGVNRAMQIHVADAIFAAGGRFPTETPADVIEAAADVLNEVSERKDVDYLEGGFEHEAHALAAAGLLATRSEAEIKAEALREFADELAASAEVGFDDFWDGYRQAQREAEEAARRRADSLAPARSDVSEAEASEIARDLARQSAFYRDNPREDARPEEDEEDETSTPEPSLPSPEPSGPDPVSSGPETSEKPSVGLP